MEDRDSIGVESYPSVLPIKLTNDLRQEDTCSGRVVFIVDKRGKPTRRFRGMDEKKFCLVAYFLIPT